MAVVQEEGSKIRQAVAWVSEMTQKFPEKKRMQIILEAQTKFDLSPKESQFLINQIGGE